MDGQAEALKETRTRTNPSPIGINHFNLGKKRERNKHVLKLIFSSKDVDVEEDQVCARERHICGRALIDVEENWVRALL